MNYLVYTYGVSVGVLALSSMHLLYSKVYDLAFMVLAIIGIVGILVSVMVDYEPVTKWAKQ